MPRSSSRRGPLPPITTSTGTWVSDLARATARNSSPAPLRSTRRPRNTIRTGASSVGCHPSSSASRARVNRVTSTGLPMTTGSTPSASAAKAAAGVDTAITCENRRSWRRWTSPRPRAPHRVSQVHGRMWKVPTTVVPARARETTRPASSGLYGMFTCSTSKSTWSSSASTPRAGAGSGMPSLLPLNRSRRFFARECMRGRSVRTVVLVR